MEYDIPAISGVDTRMITRIIRDEGSQKVIICDANVPYEEALKKVREYIIPTDMVSRVSCKNVGIQELLTINTMLSLLTVVLSIILFASLMKRAVT